MVVVLDAADLHICPQAASPDLPHDIVLPLMVTLVKVGHVETPCHRETGRSRTIVRGGSRLVIALERDGRLDIATLPRRTATSCSHDELVETSWEGEWKP